jgi:hypothetical protein
MLVISRDTKQIVTLGSVMDFPILQTILYKKGENAEALFVLIIFSKMLYCRETTLTGESRCYISTPLGIEPGPS